MLVKCSPLIKSVCLPYHTLLPIKLTLSKVSTSKNRFYLFIFYMSWLIIFKQILKFNLSMLFLHPVSKFFLTLLCFGAKISDYICRLLLLLLLLFLTTIVCYQLSTGNIKLTERQIA